MMRPLTVTTNVASKYLSPRERGAEKLRIKTLCLRCVRAALLGVALGSTAPMPITPALAQQKNPDRNAYFGETHLHTSWSADAWLFGNQITGPADAYKYAKGETIKHPLGYNIKIDTPLDFMGVTDHSEYVGITKMANTPRFAGQQAPRDTGPHHHGPQAARSSSSAPSCRSSG